MEGYFNSMVGEVHVFSIDLALCWYLLNDKVFVLAREVHERSPLDGSLGIEIPIFGSPIPFSFSLVSNSFLELSP